MMMASIPRVPSQSKRSCIEMVDTVVLFGTKPCQLIVGGTTPPCATLYGPVGYSQLVGPAPAPDAAVVVEVDPLVVAVAPPTPAADCWPAAAAPPALEELEPSSSSVMRTSSAPVNMLHATAPGNPASTIHSAAP